MKAEQQQDVQRRGKRRKKNNKEKGQAHQRCPSVPVLLLCLLAAALAVTPHHTHPPSAICHPSLLDRALHTK
jgi:hypothetical protein